MVNRRTRTLGLLTLAIGAMILAAALLISALSGPAHRPKPRKPTARATPFAANSIWNAALPADAPLARNSSALVKQLAAQVSRDGTWINTYAYSTPIYTVPASQPRVAVTLDAPLQSSSAVRLAQAFRAGVPIPPTATPAPGTDGNMVIWQPSTDTMWEFWIARHVGSGWHAQWGGRMDRVSENPGYFTDPRDWGTTATSLALLGGTMRVSELRAGHINHALAIAIPEARAGVVAAPAQRTDGKLSDPNAIPEGTRFRLDPRLNLDRLKLPPLTRMIAEAAQRYGLFVRDQSGAVAFYAEQTTAGPNPYYGPTGMFGASDPAKLTRAFPWSYLQVVNAPLSAYR